MGRPPVTGFSHLTDARQDVVTVTVHRAVVDTGPPHLATIHVATELPPDPGLGDPQRAALHYERWRDDAEAIHKALSHSLPGGTLDALFALMAADRASAYVVPAAYRDTAGKLRELLAGVDALVDLFEGEDTRPAARPGPEAAEPVEARIECGAHLHPNKTDIIGPIACVLDSGHEDYHSDGHGNRWTT